ncbi:MAG: hypothetical protein J3R72DRAFT_528857 [Linnemannia gamsii]|nr:MAG: hypothetical protein J3R72DRAFT_528857 [Linnemannia gamsii]
MAQPTRHQQQQQQQQEQHKDDNPADSSFPQQSKRKTLTIHPPSPMRIPTSTATNFDIKPRRSSSISSQTSSIFSQSGPPSSSSSFFPSSPLFRSSYNKLGGSTVGMGTVGVGSVPHTVVGFSPYLGQQSPYGAATAAVAGRRGFASSSSLSLLSSHPSSPVVSPASTGAYFTTEKRRPFDMDAIDVSESESEGGSIDGNDTSESEFSESEAETDEGDDVLSINVGSSSDRDDSDNEEDRDDSSGVESPISTYDPTPAASMLSSSAPSPSMMTGRLGLFGGVQQQTTSGDILRRSQEVERQRFSLQDATLARDQQRVDGNSAIVFDKQATTTAPEVHLTEGRRQEANIVIEQGGGLATDSEQDSEAEESKEDTESIDSSMPPSPALSHSPFLHSSQSTSPSSPSLSVSHHPFDSDLIPDATRLPEELSSPSSTGSPVIPDTEEQNVVIEPYAVAAVDDLVDEGVFEEEEGSGVEQGLNDRDKAQDGNSHGSIEADAHSDSYGSLPLYTTHPTPISQQRKGIIEQDQGPSTSSEAVVAELKEVRTMLQDLHKRMDRLEQSLHVHTLPNGSNSTRPLVTRRLSSSSGQQKDIPSSSSPETRRRGIFSIIKGMATPQRRRGGGGGGIARIAILVLFFGLILLARRSYRKRNLRSLSLSSLLGMDWTATAVKQFARSRLGFLERRVSRLRLVQS